MVGDVVGQLVAEEPPVAAATERAAINAPLPPVERAHHERATASVRDPLGEGLVDRAEIEGILTEELMFRP